jgi:hypothetical protein
VLDIKPRQLVDCQQYTVRRNKQKHTKEAQSRKTKAQGIGLPVDSLFAPGQNTAWRTRKSKWGVAGVGSVAKRLAPSAAFFMLIYVSFCDVILP